MSEQPVNLRNLGRVRVLRALADTGRLSRPELVRRTGLARATVGSVITELVRSGIVAEEPANRADRPPGTGRPAGTVALNPDVAHAVGVDIGRDHVRVALCDLAGDPVWDRTLPLAADHRAADVLPRTAELVRRAQRDADVPAHRVLGVGVGLACPIDRAGRLRAEGILPGWVGAHPAEDLRRLTGLPVRLVNDANAAVLAERRYGAARHADNVCYLRLSTGIGAGLICEGQLLLGARGLAGELGHVIVEPHGVICRCGSRGCLETVASPTAVAALLPPRAGHPVTTAELIDLVRAQDRGALRAVEDAGEAVGRALAMTVTVFNPERVVIGGELAAAGDALLRPIQRAITRGTLTSHADELQVVPGALGDSAGVLGAAALVLADAPERLAALPAEPAPAAPATRPS